MAASKRQMNTRAVSFTPLSGSATNYTGVTNLQFMTNGNIAKFSGDGDLFTTLAVHDFSDPGAVVTTADLAAALANGVGTRGTLVGTFKDARNQSATSAAGDITVTLLTAIIQDIPIGGAYRQFGAYSIPFASESADGVTSPISFAIA